MPTGKPIGHPISSPMGAAVSYAPHQLGGGLKPLFKALGPGSNGELTTHPAAGTGSATFTRADGATDIAHVRDFENLYKKVPAAEARFQGARRVRNIVRYSEDLTDAAWVAFDGLTKDTATQVTFVNSNSNLRQAWANQPTKGIFVVSFDIWGDSTDLEPELVDTADGSDSVKIDITVTSTRTRYSFKADYSASSTFSGNLRFDFNRTGSVATPGAVVNITNIQLEEVSGQTNQAPSEYVATGASAVTKYFYTENNNEVAENQLLQSRQFDTTWTSSSLDALTQDETGYDGQANKAWTGTGSSTLDVVYQDVTIPADTRDYVFSIYIKKDSDETRFPQIYLALFTGGTQVDEAVYFNTKTGDINNLSGFDDGTTLVEDRGDWWKVSCSLTNSNNTVARCHYYPSYSSSFTSAVAVAGSSIFDQAQLLFDASTATETQVETTTAAITNVVGTKTAQWEQVDNNLTYSYDLTQWSLSGTDVADLNEVGIYGEANTATTLTDNDGAVYENMATQITVTDNANWHVYSVIVKKDNTPASTRLVGIDINLTGGTAQRNLQGLDTSTGELTSGQETGSVFSYSESFNDNWWKVSVAVKNNSSGNTTCLVRAYPAIGNSGTPVTSAATGSCIIGHAQLSLNRIFPYSGLVTTTGSAITLGKERGLDDQLHPIGVKQNATYFKRFNKWASATAYSVGDHIIPDTGSGPAGGDGYYYVCVVGGTSAGSEPSFNNTIGDGTYDNGVVWKCLGKATIAGYLAEPARTNSITDSYDLTAWTQNGTAVSSLDAVGIDGVANHATTLTDNDGAAYESVLKSLVISNDTNTHTFQTFIKKDSDTSRFVGIEPVLLGGTNQGGVLHLNTSTGAITESNTLAGGGVTGSWVEDHGSWWRVVAYITNNNTGNVTAQLQIYAAVSTVFGTVSIAATGSCIVGHVQVELNTAVPSSPILTTGAADTRAIDQLYYSTTGNFSNNQGSLVFSWLPQYDEGVAPSGNRGLISVTASNANLAYINGSNFASNDGTTIPTLSVSGYQYNDSLKSGVRWNDSLSKFQLANNGTSGTDTAYDGAFDVTTDQLLVTYTGGGIDCMSDVLIYNKDLGTAKLESMTDYD